MKPIINKLTSFLPAIPAPSYKIDRKQKMIGCAMVIFALTSLAGCFSQYYKTNSVNKTDAATIQKLVDGGKYFILHSDKHTYGLSEVKVNDEIVEAEVNVVAPEHLNYLTPGNKYSNRFPKKGIDVVLYEVHLYTNNKAAVQTHISLPVKEFYQMDVYALNEKDTHKSKVMSTVGVSLTVVGILLVIIVAVAASSFHIGG